MSDRRIIFASIAEPNRRYTAHSYRADWKDHYRSADRHVADWVGWFDTLGDGNTQHTPEVPVPCDWLGDYTASLAAYLIDAHEEDVAMVAATFYRSTIDLATIRFAASVKYNPDKRRWYSMDERKISAADSRRHDRRWKEVPTWADGQAEAVVSLLCDAFPRYDLIDRYYFLADVLTAMENLEIIGCGIHPTRFLPAPLDKADAWSLRMQMGTLRDIVESFRRRKEAIRWVEVCRDQVKRKAVQETSENS